MAVTKSKIREWIRRGLECGATHLICVCDTFDWEDYPAYVMKNESVQQKVDRYNRSSMQMIMEVYDLSMDIEMQLAEELAYHL